MTSGHLSLLKQCAVTEREDSLHAGDIAAYHEGPSLSFVVVMENRCNDAALSYLLGTLATPTPDSSYAPLRSGATFSCTKLYGVHHSYTWSLQPLGMRFRDALPADQRLN